MENKNKKQDAERVQSYLAKGFSLEKAASFAGVDLSRAIELVIELRTSLAYDADILRQTSMEAMMDAISVLKTIAYEGEDPNVMCKAAGELLKFSLEVRKLLDKAGIKDGNKEAQGEDLWQFSNSHSVGKTS